MIKDIPKYIVQDVAIAVVKEDSEKGEPGWAVYIVNMKDDELQSVLVSSKGYGTYNGEEVRTSTLRHFLEDVPGKSFAKIEPILDTLFGLTNEFWLSYYLNGGMYDKKYIFLPESITEEHFINIPLMNKKGVMIK
jgi:hypothetical protein